MKSASIILNGILLIAVAVLYYLHFSNKPEPVQAIPAAAFKSANIVFVNSDSLLSEYNYFKNKKSEFEQKENKVKGDLKAESSKLQSDVEEYRQKAAGMTDQQRQQTEEQFGMRQQQLMQKKDALLGQLDDEQNKTNDELHTKLITFMKEYNKKKNFNFIFGYQKGGGILFANDSLDITKEVVEGLNKAYEKEEKK